jgi:hypothetical protein
MLLNRFTSYTPGRSRFIPTLTRSSPVAHPYQTRIYALYTTYIPRIYPTFYISKKANKKEIPAIESRLIPTNPIASQPTAYTPRSIHQTNNNC